MHSSCSRTHRNPGSAPGSAAGSAPGSFHAPALPRPKKAGSGGEGDRTPDLVNAIHALSQLSYAPHSPDCTALPDDLTTPQRSMGHQSTAWSAIAIPLAMPPTPINSPSSHPHLDAGLHALRNWRTGFACGLHVRASDRSPEALQSRHLGLSHSGMTLVAEKCKKS
jgi:hypothetical protein